VSIQTSGIGTPSFSIVMEELLMLGATRFIRTGTCGGIGRGLRTGDIVVATAAVPADGSTRTYLHGDPYAPAADFELTRALVDAARGRGLEPNPGLVQSVDVFYNPDADYASKMRSRGVLAVEMEAAALFLLAARERGAGKDVRGACILTVSDTLMKDDEAVGGDYMSLESLEEATRRMIEVALDAGTAEFRTES
jgi:uridine phosphorylase